MRAISVLLVILAILSIPAGKLSVLEIAGRTPDLFYLDVVMLFASISSAFGLTGMAAVARSNWGGLILFCFCVLLGGFLGSDWLSYLGQLRSVYYAFVIVSIISHGLSDAEQVNWLAAAICVSTLGIAVALLSAEGWQVLLPESEKSLVKLDWGRSNYFATFALVSFFVAIGLLLSERGSFYRGLAILAIIGSLVVLIVAKSRAAMLVFVLVTVAGYGMFRDPSRGAARLTFSIAFAFVALAAALPLVLSLIGANSEDFVDSGNLRRIDAWVSAMSAFLSSPIIGIGWSNTTTMADTLSETGTTTHSLPLQLLAETGIIGFLAFWWTIRGALGPTGVFPRIALDFRLRNGLKLATYAALLHCLVEPSFWGTSFTVVIWTCISVLHCSAGSGFAVTNSHTQHTGEVNR